MGRIVILYISIIKTQRLDIQTIWQSRVLGDLQIIKSSVFDSINYAVFIKGSAKIMIINASNTIDFIIHYAQVNELLNTSAIKFTDAVKKDELILPETLYIPRPIRGFCNK